MKTITYILTYNAAEQLRVLVRSLTLFEPAFLKGAVVVDQSTIPACANENARLCASLGLPHRPSSNSGASGGRFVCAELFAQTDYDAMFFFEDDMSLWHEQAARCRFGFPNHVSDLRHLCCQILTEERLDYLKLSFHEVYNDHSHDFEWNRPATFSKLGSKSGVGYFVGEVYYSNWPMLITQRGSGLLFEPPRVTEGDVRKRAADAIERGQLCAGVLAAWPVRHHRIESTIKIDLA